ncbi:MAG: class I SAM-dependent methyltransferase [Nitrospinota bacterium]|nr:class I SAM-dependent methyltransferase [Nitrospinota bacterium]
MNEVEQGIINAQKVIQSFDGTDQQNFLNRFVNSLIEFDGLITGLPDEEQIRQLFFEKCEILDHSPLHHRMRHKPLGYSGDYLLLDWIQTRRISGNGLGQAWDRLFHDYPGAIAVRNRKQVFRNYLEEFRKLNTKASILDLACGSCRYILNVIDEIDNEGSSSFLEDVTFVDNQADAIEFARALFQQKRLKIVPQWISCNVMRFRPSRKYNFIWSSGLFDYLNDDQAVFLIKRIYDWLDDEGLMVFGNFHPDQPTRIPMELCGQWFLFHRTEQDLLLLAEKAKITPSKVTVSHESTGINLFCQIRK